MNAPLENALLPSGLNDVLPPDAAREAATVERLMGVFAAHGFDRVKPPLAEFEDSLLTGPGAALAKQTFRMMDPVSQRMMAVRADMTPQIARIATTRLRGAPRPLRLSYAGQALRVKGTQLRPERQFAEVGAELIGSLRPAADAEMAALAVGALRRVGVQGLSLDLCVPTLVPTLCRALGVGDDEASQLREALDRKDAAQVAAVDGAAAAAAERLMRASGPAASALAAFAAMDLPAEAEPDRRRLVDTVAFLAASTPDLQLTVDFVERRGFEYQTGLSFTLFARGVRGELGRGGRYRAGGEPAVGFTLYLDSVLRAAPGAPAAPRAFLPWNADPAAAETLRAQGWATVAALSPEDGEDEARRLRCTHILRDGAPRELT